MRDGRPSMSAQQVALARAHLTAIGVLDDPYAAGMLRPLFRQTALLLARSPVDRFGRNGTFAYLAARTLAFDQAVTAALDAGIAQVVIVGAGYDSRAWRLARPGVRFWEVDHPATQADKRRVAPSGPPPTWVPVDLATDEFASALRDAGLSNTEPAVFLAEGLTMYLTDPQARTLFTALAGLAAAGSRLVTNFGVGFTVNPTTGPIGLIRRALLAVRGEPFRYQPDPDQARRLLAEAGWSVTELVTGPDLAARHLAGTGLPTGLNPAAFMVTATVDGQP